MSATDPAGGPTGGRRRILRRVRGLPTSDGAGVRLTRIIGQPALPELDPFLLLDEFGTDRAADYIAGFPDHPHRGFETVTYMLEGRMRHRDNHGHEGVLGPGGVQWMTAGRGIIHSEMPEQQQGRLRGFQLWINLPARDKMTAPRYQEFGPERLPVIAAGGGAQVKVIAGRYGDAVGPIRQPATDPLYLDLLLPQDARLELPVPHGHAAFVYVYEGAFAVGADSAPAVEAGPGAHELALLGPGNALELHGQAPASRAILVAARPLREPIARHGPFVMNTRAELLQAFEDLRRGAF